MQRPKTKNTENVADENRSDPVVVGALGTVKKRMVENIKKVSERATVTETQKVRTNPQEGAYCMNRMTDLSD